MNLYDYFAAACTKFSGRVAVNDNGITYSYLELFKRVEEIASVISMKAEKIGNICIFMNKSFDYVASIFAIYKCGCTFIPVEKGMPFTKIDFILNDSDSVLVLSDSENNVETTIKWINIKNCSPPFQRTEPHMSGKPLDIAYILYTSGTTGNPKGIEITHHAAYSFISWVQKELNISPSDIFSSHAPFSFDLSVLDIYDSLLSGAQLVLMPRGISAFVKSVKKYIINNHISIWYSVPSIIIKLLEHDDGNTFKGLRLLIYAGESMPWKYINKLNALYPELEIYNFYGPTETNVITYYKIEKSHLYTKEIPIGKTCPYAKAEVIKKDGTMARIGEIGELCIKSKTLMHGYRHLPLQEDVFNTGDLVKLEDTDRYVFVGRKDNMVKVNGFRIELEEIESALENYPSIDKAIVTIIKEDGKNDFLSAYYTAEKNIDSKEIRLYLQTHLQLYKIPERFEKIESIPLNSRGKKIRNI